MSSSFVRPDRRPAVILAAGAALWALACSPALAVPSFADQTGLPCNACHVGGFGPQLTVYGRQFKLQGYTQRSKPFQVPFSVMAVASYLRTQKDQPPAPGFKPNDNVALDQVSLFFASGLGSHLGAFIQATYDGVARAWSWDNLDVRATTTAQVGKTPVLFGISLNNSPTVQDAWNTLPAWGYPYTDSALAPAPAAAPLLAGALAQNTLGFTGYAWINSQIYIEAGGYGSPNASTLTSLGADPYSPGNIHGVAPYERIAFQKPLGGGTLEVGAFGLEANIYPGRDQSAGADSYRDLGVDASYVINLGDGDVITSDLRYIDEQETLDASQRLGLAQNRRNAMHDYRADVSYYWRNRIGGTLAVFRTDGSPDELLYADNRTFRPDSTGVMAQIDATPWGDGRSPFGRRVNVRVGAQYTFYPEFNGARWNYDGAGARAGDNNTFRLFTWIAF